MDYGYDSDEYVLVSASRPVVSAPPSSSSSVSSKDSRVISTAIITTATMESDTESASPKLAVRRSSLEAMAALVPAHAQNGEPLAAVFYRVALATALLAMFLTRLLSGFGGSFTNYAQARN
ncbi:hypothetical protein BDF19DRAFT_464637 [Syncephalis fuscata]|nr:hypothetical protein BDF19DRAFT_464637 [Syncephalis fuscata]